MSNIRPTAEEVWAALDRWSHLSRRDYETGSFYSWVGWTWEEWLGFVKDDEIPNRQLLNYAWRKEKV